MLCPDFPYDSGGRQPLRPQVPDASGAAFFLRIDAGILTVDMAEPWSSPKEILTKVFNS